MALNQIFLVLSFLPLGTAMGFFDAMKVNLLSEMKEVVTLNGKPVAGAIIKRTVIPNNDKEFIDRSITDSEGRFHFNRMETQPVSQIITYDDCCCPEGCY